MNLLKGTTPGPWQRDKDTGNIFVIKDDGLHGVAMAVNHADARLIAAAPDLAREVEMLREFMGFIEEIDTLKRPLTLMERHLYRLGLSYHREFSKELRNDLE